MRLSLTGGRRPGTLPPFCPVEDGGVEGYRWPRWHVLRYYTSLVLIYLEADAQETVPGQQDLRHLPPPFQLAAQVGVLLG
jgi:hypothetical protein